VDAPDVNSSSRDGSSSTVLDESFDRAGHQAEPSRYRRRRLYLGVALAFSILLAIGGWQYLEAGSDSRLRVEEPGGPAPLFELSLFDGSTFSLSRHLAQDGRPIVVNFWASWCVPCRNEMPALNDVAQRRPDVLFVGVAVEDAEKAARGFAEDVGVDYPVGLDNDGQVLAAYPTLGLPTTWFITGDGVLAAKKTGEVDGPALERLIDRYLSAG